jgi:hypothetical protein
LVIIENKPIAPIVAGNFRFLKKEKIATHSGGFVLRNRNRSVNTKTEFKVALYILWASVPSEFITIFSINALSFPLYLGKLCASLYLSSKPQ